MVVEWFWTVMISTSRPLSRKIPLSFATQSGSQADEITDATRILIGAVSPRANTWDAGFSTLEQNSPKMAERLVNITFLLCHALLLSASARCFIRSCELPRKDTLRQDTLYKGISDEAGHDGQVCKRMVKGVADVG